MASPPLSSHRPDLPNLPPISALFAAASQAALSQRVCPTGGRPSLPLGGFPGADTLSYSPSSYQSVRACYEPSASGLSSHPALVGRKRRSSSMTIIPREARPGSSSSTNVPYMLDHGLHQEASAHSSLDASMDPETIMNHHTSLSPRADNLWSREVRPISPRRSHTLASASLSVCDVARRSRCDRDPTAPVHGHEVPPAWLVGGTGTCIPASAGNSHSLTDASNGRHRKTRLRRSSDTSTGSGSSANSASLSTEFTRMQFGHALPFPPSGDRGTSHRWSEVPLGHSLTRGYESSSAGALDGSTPSFSGPAFDGSRSSFESESGFYASPSPYWEDASVAGGPVIRRIGSVMPNPGSAGYIHSPGMTGSFPKHDVMEDFSPITHHPQYNVIHPSSNATQGVFSVGPVNGDSRKPNMVIVGPRYRCPEVGCGKSFSRPSSLKIHNNSHTGQKPYRCSICDRAFSVHSNLKRHRKVHDRDSYLPHHSQPLSEKEHFSESLSPHQTSISPARVIAEHPDSAAQEDGENDQEAGEGDDDGDEEEADGDGGCS